MLAVSNTSPISNLAIIGRLELLLHRYSVIHIPAAVFAELQALSHAAGKLQIETALAKRWLVVKEVTAIMPIPFALDAGEAAAISLARQLRADVLLMDERRGREAARQLGLTVAGVLGELVYAKRFQRITTVREEILRLRREAGFFVDKGVEQFILSQAGE